MGVLEGVAVNFWEGARSRASSAAAEQRSEQNQGLSAQRIQVVARGIVARHANHLRTLKLFGLSPLMKDQRAGAQPATKWPAGGVPRFSGRRAPRPHVTVLYAGLGEFSPARTFNLEI